MKLKGKKILITAGPTYEKIDPVRFIGNNSTGKMGVAIALQAEKLGAEVDLVIGPSAVELNSSSKVNRIDVTTAQEMYEACHKRFDHVDVAIMSAAVADYRPKEVAQNKLKKKDISLTIELEPTPDILKSLGAKKKHQTLVGFALETNNEVENAKQKLDRKNLDAIVLNSLNDKGAGFGYDTNKISIITQNKKQDFALKSKQDVALDILNFIETEL